MSDLQLLNQVIANMRRQLANTPAPQSPRLLSPPPNKTITDPDIQFFSDQMQDRIRTPTPDVTPAPTIDL